MSPRAGPRHSRRSAHHAHRLHRQQHREGLPDLVIKTRLADLVDVDGIRLAKDVELFLRDVAGAADRKARSWERMPADENLGQTELAPQRSHLVLEEFA